jgi:hypothetical protein
MSSDSGPLMVPDEGALLERLAARFPGIRSLSEAHVAFYGELLPHVLLGEVAAWLQEQPMDAAVAVVAYLEREFVARPEVQEIIAVSFLELLDQRLRGVLGPAFREELMRP